LYGRFGDRENGQPIFLRKKCGDRRPSTSSGTISTA
jgi:hypothetical protein